MENSIAELLVEHNPDLRHYEQYSGRGMGGDTTDGVVGNDYELFRAIGSVMLHGSDKEVRELADELESGGWTTDNMGYDTIYY
jgi:hypothetical protein